MMMLVNRLRRIFIVDLTVLGLGRREFHLRGCFHRTLVPWRLRVLLLVGND